MTLFIPTTGPIRIAVDSEFTSSPPETLLVQTASMEPDGKMVIQMYRNPRMPDLPAGFDLHEFLERRPADGGRSRKEAYERLCSDFILQPVKLIHSGLSPLQMYADLHGRQLDPILRVDGLGLLGELDKENPPHWATYDKSGRRWVLPEIHLTLIGHFWPADFFRAFGSNYLAQVFRPDDDRHIRGLNVRSRKNIEIVEPGKRGFSNRPIVMYARDAQGILYSVRVSFIDTRLPMGEVVSGSLEAISQALLGIGKMSEMTKEELANMAATFLRDPSKVYAYSTVDAINTLLIEIAMRKNHAALYHKLKVPPDMVPEMAQTAGRRTTDVMISWSMSRLGLGDDAYREYRKLLKAGGIGKFEEDPYRSRFGRQTGSTQGGILFNRSPTKLFHWAPGQFGDVDLSSCYNTIIQRINIYLGTPFIWEPGHDASNPPTILKEAVKKLMAIAPPDGWYLRVSGDIAGPPNTLILSTLGATTNANYKKNRRKTAASKSGPWYRALDEDRANKPGSKIFTKTIESGIVTNATWTVIQALPPHMREPYENLAVDTAVFYPNRLIANNVEEYGEICNRVRGVGPGWQQQLHEVELELETHARADEQNVAIRVPVREFAELVAHERAEAKKLDGKGSAMELGWKLVGNATFGVVASEDLATNNMVAANIITSEARACAWVMTQTLNGFGPVTDGSAYRRDQIPAATFEECLYRQLDFPMRRADHGDGIQFLNPLDVPATDSEFTNWYRQRAMAFFATENADFRRLVTLHGLEHKAVNDKEGKEKVFFDGFIGFGAGDNIVLLDDGEEPFVASVKLRSYGKKSKDIVVPWLVATAMANAFGSPAPITSDMKLLRYKEAAIRLGSKLSDEVPEVLFPLGFDVQVLRKAALVRDSNFLCQNARQRKTLAKTVANYREKTGCGLELLSSGSRRGKQKTITDITATIYSAIAQGKTGFSSALNLSRKNPQRQKLAESRPAELRQLKAQGDAKLLQAMDVRNLSETAKLTGLGISKRDL